MNTTNTERLVELGIGIFFLILAIAVLVIGFKRDGMR